MNAHASVPNLFKMTIALVLGGGLTVPCHALLIDDFSASQTGIVTDQLAAFSTFIHPSILGGQRILWGGGGSLPGNCNNSECATRVSGGQMSITPGSDCAGTGNVTWNGLSGASGLDSIFVNTLNFDASENFGIEVEIAQITGQVQTLFTISSGGTAGHFGTQVEQLEVFWNSPGKHLIRFADFTPSNRTNLMDLDHITMSTYVDVGEFVAFNSVHFVPEPAAISFAVVGLLFLTAMRPGHSARRT